MAFAWTAGDKTGELSSLFVAERKIETMVFCTFVTNIRAGTQTYLCNMFTRIGFTKKGEPFPWLGSKNRKPKGSLSNIFDWLKTPQLHNWQGNVEPKIL